MIEVFQIYLLKNNFQFKTQFISEKTGFTLFLQIFESDTQKKYAKFRMANSIIHLLRLLITLSTLKMSINCIHQTKSESQKYIYYFLF